MTPRCSIIIPVYNEGEAVVPCLDRIVDAVKLPFEVLVVYDFPEDTTVEPVTRYAEKEPRVRLVLNSLGRGPAFAIRAGFDAAAAPVAVVTMADGSDDPVAIDQLVRLVERGVTVASASRYMSGGAQVGGPFFKGLMSRAAGVSLYYFARVGTRDATNSFKAYSLDFVRQVGVRSDTGFTIGLELVAKARRMRRKIAEVPTIWLDRSGGISNFKTRAWIPAYLAWYRFAYGPKLTVEQVAAHVPPSKG